MTTIKSKYPDLLYAILDVKHFVNLIDNAVIEDDLRKVIPAAKQAVKLLVDIIHLAHLEISDK